LISPGVIIRQVFDRSPNAVAVFQGGRFLLANRAAADLFGFPSVEAFVDAPLDSLLAPGWKGKALACFHLPPVDAPPVRTVVSAVRRDGSPIDLGLAVTALSVEGESYGLAAFTDETERRRVDGALRESESRYRQLFENMTTAFALHEMIYDADGRPCDYRFLAANPAFERLTGVPVAGLLGRTVREVLPGTEPYWIETYGRVVETGEPAAYENFSAALGRWYETWAFRPSPGRFAVIFSDVTERKGDEEERAHLARQLQQAQKMELVGRLAGGVAHDFNNMLGAILGHTDLALAQLPPGSPLNHTLEEIRGAAIRSAELTRRLLTLARRQVSLPKVLDLNRSVTEMRGMLERLAGEDVSLSLREGEGLWPVLIDPSHLDQILTNLVVNARDAIPGRGTIVVETSNVSLDEAWCHANPGARPGDYVLLSVTDSGTGMDRETLSRIFEPFFTTKEAGKGTGLGLSTVYSVVRQNGGVVNVYSEPGSGSTFRIYLPRRSGEGERAEPAPKPPSAAAADGGAETVLLVEDDPTIREVALTVLRRRGYRVLSAPDAEEGLALLAAHDGPLHLLVTDVVMPGMNGRELSERVTALRPEARILFISGYPPGVLQERGILPESVGDYLQKPFTASDLASTVRSILDR
jgi:PAS domain S-box-containing protein